MCLLVSTTYVACLICLLAWANGGAPWGWAEPDTVPRAGGGVSAGRDRDIFADSTERHSTGVCPGSPRCPAMLKGLVPRDLVLRCYPHSWYYSILFTGSGVEETPHLDMLLLLLNTTRTTSGPPSTRASMDIS